MREQEEEEIRREAIAKKELDELRELKRLEEVKKQEEERKVGELRLLERVKRQQMEDAVKAMKEKEAEGAGNNKQMEGLMAKEAQLMEMIARKEEEKKKIELELLMKEQDDLVRELEEMKTKKKAKKAKKVKKVKKSKKNPTETMEKIFEKSPENVENFITEQEQKIQKMLAEKEEEELTHSVLAEKMRILKLLEEKQELEKKLLLAEQDKMEQEIALHEQMTTVKKNEQKDILEMLLKAQSGLTDETQTETELESTIAAFEKRKHELEEIMKFLTNMLVRLDH